MELQTISTEMLDRIKELDGYKTDLPVLAQEMAIAVNEYEKCIATVSVGLKNGKSYQIDGAPVQESSTTLIRDLSRGICHVAKLRMDLAESKYKNALKNIDMTLGQMMGLGSLNKHQSEV